MKKETAIAAIIVAAVLAFVGGYLASDYGPKITKTDRPGTGGTYDSSILPLGESPTRGPADAAATVVFFTDFSSSSANAAFEDVLSDDELGDTVRFAVKPIAGRGESGRRAAAAAYFAAENDVFWDGVNAALHQASTDAQIDSALEDAGLSRSDFAQALESGRYDALIEADLNLARSLEAADQPTLFVNGQRVGGATLSREVRAELGAGEALTEAGISPGQVYAVRVRANLEPTQMVARPTVDDEMAALRRELGGQGGGGEGRGRADRDRLDRDDLVAARDRARERVERRDRDGGGGAERDEGARPAARAERPAAEPPSGDVERLRVPIDDSYVRGSDDALVTIVEFSDFHCPFCGRVTPTLETLFEEYGSDIRLAFKHNPLPMHPDSPMASEAALAAGEQGKFWEMHDILFANQRTARTREQLEGLASQLGLDTQAFNAYIDAERGAEQIEADQALAGRVGARGTPHFFINGRRLRGAQPIDAFREIIDEEIALGNQMVEEGVARDQIYATLMEDAQERATPERREEPQSARVEPPPIGDSPTVGPDDADVTIFVFSEFQCPFCNRARPTIDQIREQYGDQVRLVFKSFPLPMHNNAALAAQAALAAHEQGKFWEYHDILFDNQRALSRADLERYAEQVGLDMDQFRDALDSGRFQEQIDREMAEGRRAGVSGTPTFIVNGERVVGALPFDRFQPVIERALQN